ncbi:glycine-rich domain-containing protein [Deinococcus multiflagellatus]|uniref:Glycine-rich domain-containing protein n=1 Tax=Deinococcus multiflagellatus TaxID=1656887 RepID=A0ABW1ZPU2_9DEIO|nr:hypothetical protein [Deinococcus multiflagellatus]MBZ9714660.1 hypothetical protein [Deinococcus multiflagellatus]
MSHHDTISQPKVNAALSPLPTSPLWITLSTYALPEALLRRLSKQQRWTWAQTQAAAQEYLRFVYLAATCPHPVTPSRAVDEVWHLHLTFTRDYWERLTPLLPRPLHHEPGEGLPGDADRFAAQYQQTLAAYAQVFGHAAPAELWPAPRRQPQPAAPTRRRIQGSARVTSLGLALIAAVAAGLTFAWSAAALWIALGAFVAVLLLAQTATAAATPARPRPDPASGTGSDGGAWMGGASSAPESSCADSAADSPCSDGSSGGDGGGSSCGGGCGGGGCGS